jgi:hypothetical protein
MSNYTDQLQKVMSLEHSFCYRGCEIKIVDGWFDVFGVLVSSQRQLDKIIDSAYDSIRQSLVKMTPE